jgi:hypothetical protein
MQVTALSYPSTSATRHPCNPWLLFLVIPSTKVWADYTIFCAAVSVVPAVVKIVCILQIMLSIPETMVCTIEKTFSTAESISQVNERWSPA